MEIEETEEDLHYSPEYAEETKNEGLQTNDFCQKSHKQSNRALERSSFVDGLAVGLGVGGIASFVIVWLSLFFSPLLPASETYESLLATFIYPLISLLAAGLVALTAGVVREYYSKNKP